jgi:hypothetical protein
MIALFFLLIAAAGAAMIGSVLHTRSAASQITGRVRITALFPKGIALLFVVGHFSELLRAVEHISFVHIAIALFLLVAWKASASGSESELF